ncbi:methicillin resistance protein FmtA [Sphingobium cloacae]|uniref:Methicillin resistance protein FmtA n=3 Tax=Sphingobium cloacae TaxID=120107 RepID=A0A1E1EXU1_9SPHN|nr:methicillin resistance protein FmtA [Sphingobium cloacae]
MLAGAALWFLSVPAAYAQSAPDAPQASARGFSIPAQPLRDALLQLMRDGSLQIAFEPADVDGRTSSTVSGSMSAGEALSRLLTGTGLTFRYVTTGSVVLERAPQSSGGAIELGPVRVEGAGEQQRYVAAPYSATGPARGYAASRSEAGTKTDTTMLENPQSVSIVTSEQMAARAVTNIGDALAYTAGALDTFGGSDPRWSFVFTRGFSTMGNVYLDGTRIADGFFGSARVEPYGLERIELLKGPASMLYGQSPPGGLLNQVTKRPQAQASHEINLTLGNFDRYQGSFDTTGPIDEDGTFLYRLTGLVRNSGTQIDHIGDDRYYIAPAFTWAPSTETSFTLLTHFQREDLGPQAVPYPAEGTLYRSDVFGQIPRDLFIGEPAYNRYLKNQYSIGYNFEQKLGSAVTFRQNVRFLANDLDYRTLNGYGLLADGHSIDRGSVSSQERMRSLVADNNLQILFGTGPITHQLLVGADYRWSRLSYEYGSADVTPFDLLNPVYGLKIDPPAPRLKTTVSLQQLGVYAQDQIKFDRLVLTLGGRFDWADDKTRDRLDGTTSTEKYHAFTGRAGLNYVFDNGIAPYVSYSSSFEPITGTYAPERGGARFKPTRGEQYEAGVKYQPMGSGSYLTASVYQLTQKNVVTDDPLYQDFSVQTGEIRVRGIELEGLVTLTQGLNLAASATRMDTKVTQSNTGTQGNRLNRAPKTMANAWLDYTFQKGSLSGFGLGAGVRYVASRFGNITNTVLLPSYTVFDGALHYDLDKWRVQLNANNLFDKRYVAICTSPDNCVYGASRTIVATLGYRF